MITFSESQKWIIKIVLSKMALSKFIKFYD